MWNTFIELWNTPIFRKSITLGIGVAIVVLFTFILRKINNLHLLVVVFFENTEMREYLDKDAVDTQEVYFQTTARQFLTEKQQIVYKLRQYGIQSILTAPEDLSINTVNKYLELKSRGLI